MKNSELIQANIYNLTSLWKTAGILFESYNERSDFAYCIIPNSDWPNRLWFNGEINNEKTLASALETMLSAPTDLLLPIWDIYDYPFDNLENNCFTKRFELLGMSLKLENSYEEQRRLDIRLVSSKEQVQMWTNIYPESFGYRINPKILMNTSDDINFYLTSYQGQPVGTAILFNTKNIAGIHGMGIIPKMRRRGFAEEIMKFLLNQAKEAGMDYATLQASDMGKELYLKLGFEEQFAIKHYALDKINLKNKEH